jgi:hypothetical protein
MKYCAALRLVLAFTVFTSVSVFACKPIIYTEVFFANGAVASDEKSRNKVIALVEKAMLYPSTIEYVTIYGLADVSEGGVKSAQSIAVARAEYIKALMIRAGLSTGRILVEATRVFTPRATSKIPLERRVDIEILYFPPGSCSYYIPPHLLPVIPNS